MPAGTVLAPLLDSDPVVRGQPRVVRSAVCAIPLVSSVKDSIRAASSTARWTSPKVRHCAGTAKRHWPLILRLSPLSLGGGRPGKHAGPRVNQRHRSTTALLDHQRCRYLRPAPPRQGSTGSGRRQPFVGRTEQTNVKFYRLTESSIKTSNQLFLTLYASISQPFHSMMCSRITVGFVGHKNAIL
jgi:hypothetical protein